MTNLLLWCQRVGAATGSRVAGMCGHITCGWLLLAFVSDAGGNPYRGVPRWVDLQQVVSLPTAFTPNGDGVNDTWRPAYTDSVETMEVKLYDMQAQLVFDSKELYFAWNGLDKKGRPCAVGEYLFTVQYRYKGTLQRMKGALLLLR